MLIILEESNHMQTLKIDAQLATGVLKLLIASFYKNVEVKHYITGEPTKIPIYINPIRQDLIQIKKVAFPKNILPFVRFLADKTSKKVYVWHGEIGGYHKNVEKALHLPENKILRGMALILPNYKLKAIETSGIQKNSMDWTWVDRYIKNLEKVMSRNI